MNLRLGIYDIFSRIIPGGVYIVAIGQLATMLRLMNLDWQTLNNLSFTSSVALMIAAYVIGEAFDPFALFWSRLFRAKRGITAESLEIFKKKHKEKWNIDVEDDDWHILLGYIRSRSMELAGEIERHNALAIMFRNISFGLLLIAVINLVQYFLVGKLMIILLAFTLFILALVLKRESIKFRRWYCDSILSTAVAFRLDLEKIIKPVRHTPKKKSDEP